MTSANRERVKELLSRAARIPVQDRIAFIKQASGADQQTAAEAIDLLATLDDSQFMSAPTGGGLAAALPDASMPGEGPGTRIDRYKLLQLIGEGGFGSVFLAEQTEPVHRRVALKIIKAGMDTKQVIARFEAERQALALMDHPNIARVLDAGATVGGRPYFVMELVRGEPLTQYCDRERLPVRERLQLFRDVCNAVQHAHQKGIIHRDLKPSNVLVTVADGQPLPKVIDFGIAKATASRLTDKTLFTEMHQLIGTPEYMSPEQAEVAGVDIDTRSDVYSLGVLLYELLAGSTPLERSRLRSTPLAEIQRLIREEEPPRPSLRLATLASSSPSSGSSAPSLREGDSGGSSIDAIAWDRRSEPSTLVRALRGDLDWIILKCIEKDRRRRYQTANALADDIGRYLMDQPVLATPPSRSYKLRKFARRNKPVVAAVAAIMLILAAATTVSVAFAVRTSRALASEENQRNLAEDRARETEEVAKFQEAQLSDVKAQIMGVRFRQSLLEEVRKGAERGKLQPEEVNARIAELEKLIAGCDFTGIALESLDQNFFNPARAAIEKQFADLPLVKARLLQTLASTLRKVGLYDAANDPQMEALAIRQRLLGDDHRDTLASRNKLGLLRQDQGKLAEAEAYFRETLEKRRRVLGDDDRDTIASINNLGLVLYIQGKLGEAEPYCREALEKYRLLLGNADPNTLNAIQNMGFLLLARGKRTEAESYYREAHERSREALGEDHPDTIISIGNMGYFLQTMGKQAEAERYCREALERSQRTLGHEHHDTLGALLNMGAVLSEQGKLDEAEPYVRQALELFRRVLGDEHPSTVTAFDNMGALLKRKGEQVEAETYYRQAVMNHRRISGDDHPDTLKVIHSLGEVLHGQHKYAEAVELMGPAEAAMRPAFARDRVRLGRFLTTLGCARVATREFGLAEANLTEAQSILKIAAGATDRDRQDMLNCLIELYEAWGAAEPDKGYRTTAAELRVGLDAAPVP